MNAGRGSRTKGRGRRSRSPSVTAVLWLSLAGLGLATLLGRLGRASWFFDLFAHFALQYAVALAGVLLAALFLRRWGVAFGAALVLIPNLLALGYYYPVRPGPGSPADLRVLSFNVLTANPNRDSVGEYLAASEADLILVMETDRAWLDALAPLHSQYPHVVQVPRADNFGMAFFSRHPIESYELHAIEGSSVPCLSAVVSVNGHRISVIGGHPVPPVGRAAAASRNAYLAALANLTLQSSRPTIVMGDLNVSVWSPHFRDLIRSSALVDSGHKRGFQATWRREWLLFAIPIDHILHSSDLRCVGREIGPGLGSDHRAVLADLVFQNSEPGLAACRLPEGFAPGVRPAETSIRPAVHPLRHIALDEPDELRMLADQWTNRPPGAGLFADPAPVSFTQIEYRTRLFRCALNKAARTPDSLF